MNKPKPQIRLCAVAAILLSLLIGGVFAGDLPQSPSLWIIGYLNVQAPSNETIQLIEKSFDTVDVQGLKMNVNQENTCLRQSWAWPYDVAKAEMMLEGTRPQTAVVALAKSISDGKIAELIKTEMGEQRTSNTVFGIKELNEQLRGFLATNGCTGEFQIIHFRLAVMTNTPAMKAKKVTPVPSLEVAPKRKAGSTPGN